MKTINHLRNGLGAIATTFCRAAFVVITALFTFEVCTAQSDALEMMQAPCVDNDKQQNLWLRSDGKGGLLYILSPAAPHSPTPVKAKQPFALRHGGTNVFIEWYNPLTHTVQWTDTLVEDPFDKAVRDFFTLLIAQFELDPALSTAIRASNALALPANAMFVDADLALWQQSVISVAQLAGTDAEFVQLSSLLHKVDDAAAIDHKGNAKACFGEMTGIVDPNEILDKKGKYLLMTNALDKVVNDTTAFRKSLDALEAFDTGSLSWGADIKNLTRAMVAAYVVRMREKLATIRGAVKSLVRLREALDSSVKRGDVVNVGGVEYARMRGITLPSGKVMRTTLTISENALDASALTSTKGKQLVTVDLTFYRYRSFIPASSAGIAYTELVIKSFGTGTDSTGATIVEEVKQGGGKPIATIMLNYYWNANVPGLLPLLQFGISPVKERPFVLLGAGLFVPAVKLSISGGAICGFDQKLDGVNVGDKVEGTAIIKEKTSYEFDWQPKLYVGLQYTLEF